MEPDKTSKPRATAGSTDAMTPKPSTASKTVSSAQTTGATTPDNPDADWSPATQGETGPPAGDSGDQAAPPSGSTTSTSDNDWSPAEGGTAPTSRMGTEPSGDGRGRTADAASGVSETFDRARRELSDAIARLKEEASRVDTQRMGQQARGWVEENPALATALAVGAGLLLGKALGAAFKPEPPTLKKRAKKALREARSYSTGIADVVAGHAAATGAALATGAVTASKKARRWSEGALDHASEWGEEALDRAADWKERAAEAASDFGDLAADKASAWGDTVAGSTRAARKDLRKRTKRARKAAGKRVDMAGSAFDAAQAAIATIVAQKVTDLTRRWR